MTRWIEIRDQLPPEYMQVLFYIRDEIEGYTEDYITQGCITEITNEGTIDQKVSYKLSAKDLDDHEKISYWTLLPEFPIAWK